MTIDPNLTKFGEYLIPLVVAKRNEANEVTLERFAGSSFFITSDGIIATCAHIINGINKDEFLVGQDTVTKNLYEITDIACHPNIDFAIGSTSITPSKFITPYERDIYLGLDVLAFGYMAIGKFDRELKISTRMLKGYISRISIGNEGLKTKESVELSFPSLSGFSGAPVWVWNTKSFAGMLFTNLESSIETYSFEERSESNFVAREKIYRIMEFGLMHSLSTIKECIKYFGINAFK